MGTTARNVLTKLVAGVSTRANLLSYSNANLDIIDAAIAKCNFAGGAIDPDADNDVGEGYAIGSEWHTDTAIWTCIDATEGAAVWHQVWPALVADMAQTGALAQCNISASTDPGVGDDSVDGYSTGSWWWNTTGHRLWQAESVGVGAAVWRQVWPALATDATTTVALAGRSGGQAIIGGTDSGDDLSLESTSNGTKGEVLIQPNGGRVGIGVAAADILADALLDARLATGTANQYLTAYAGGAGSFIGRSAAGTPASPTATLLDVTIAAFGARGYGASAFASGTKAIIQMKAGENWTNAAQGTYIDIGTTPNLSTTRATAMRVFGHKGVHIGGTSDPGATNLLVDGTVLASNVQAAYPTLPELTTPEAGDKMPIYDVSTSTYKHVVVAEIPVAETFTPIFTGFTVSAFTATRIVHDGILECWIKATLSSAVSETMAIAFGYEVSAQFPEYGVCGEAYCQDVGSGYAATFGHCVSSAGWYGVDIYSPSALWANTVPITWASGDLLFIHARVPVVV